MSSYRSWYSRDSGRADNSILGREDLLPPTHFEEPTFLERCEFCHKVSFTKLFGVTNFKRPHEMTYKPKLRRNPGYRLGCELCRLLGKCLPSDDRKTDLFQLKPVLATEALCLSVTDRDPTYARETAIYAEVVTGMWGMSVDISYPSSIFLALEQPPSSQHYFRPQPDPSALIDFLRVKKWLKNCQTKHDAQCSHSIKDVVQLDADNLEGFRLIDVQTLEIVPAASWMRYVTLSYVWGRSSRSIAQWENLRSGDLTKLPATIADAIEVTRQLGERYLWVDQVCINQGNAHETRAQIQNMCQIYAQALLTIVALSSQGADSGLPGGSAARPRELHHLSAMVNEYRVIARKIASVEQFATTYWNTRAWTMQEAMFSRRCLCFTDEEVILWCKSHIYREIVDDASMLCQVEPRWDDTAPDAKTLPMRMSFREKWNLESYMRLVAMYTSRDLTYGTDALNAFAGISRQLEISLDSAFYWGLPAVGFIRALLWLPRQRFTSQQVRHPNLSFDYFPSWSWAGTAGGVDYNHLTGYVMGIYELPKRKIPHEEQGRITELFPRFGTEGSRVRLPINVAEIVQYPDEDSPNPKMLVLKTWVANFRLVHDMDYKILTPTGRQIFDLLGRANLRNCMKEQNGNTLKDLHNVDVKFIILMRWNGFKRIGDTSTIDVVYTMLVRFVGDVAYRVAIVAFDARDWEATSASYQQVTLG
jgi:Heterokaryon incompatibility protein (HET)